MSLDKAIEHNKEHRKKYTDSRRFDGTCRNHGACSWCEGNRKFFDTKNRLAADIDEQLDACEWCSKIDEKILD